MVKYDHIMAKTADVQYKIMLGQLAVANELGEANRLKRIELAITVHNLDERTKMNVEGYLQEDLDLEDNAIE